MNKAPNYIIERLWSAPIPEYVSKQYLEQRDNKLPEVIYSDIRVLTANKGTLNHTFYPEESLRGSADEGTGLISFNRPYFCPIIRDHLSTPGPMGTFSSEVYGRVYHPAQIHSANGETYLRAVATLTHQEAIENVLTGRWLTVSLGSRTNSVKCSICQAELTEAGCDHNKGSAYEVDDAKKTALWVIGPIKAKEISFVVTPSDDQAGILNPNLTESAGPFNAMPRLLVGDKQGIWDLATGARVEESDIFARPTAGKIFGGLKLTGSSSLKESHMADTKDKTVKPSSDETEKQNAEEFKGEGRYLLIGWGHDHDVMLDANGDGVTSEAVQEEDPYNDPDEPAEPAPHTHEIVGGICRSAGDPAHTHFLEVAHAAKEAAESEDGDDTVVTLGQLYLLPEDHEDFDKPAEWPDGESAEAVLSTKKRNSLPDSSFCGPDRSFPAHDAAHVRNALARLPQSKLSSAQKARVLACLRRKAKQLGVKVSDEMMAYAAKVVDPTHRIEINLYAMPGSLAEAEALLKQVNLVPYTPTEKESILSRIAFHCKSVLEAADWQKLFGSMTSCEAGEPVEIQITAENYGLIYTLAEGTAEVVSCACDEKVEEKVEEKAAEAQTETKTETPTDETKTEEAETSEEKLPVVPFPETETPATDKPKEFLRGLTTEQLQAALAEANAEVAEGNRIARLALAHSVSLYMMAIRHPLSRGKSNEELIKLLSGRSLESLRDTLGDVLLQMQTQGVPTTSLLPKLDDPTETTAETTPKTAPTSDATREADAPKAEDADALQSDKKAVLSPLVEMTDEEEEETYNVLGHMFGKLKVEPRR